MYDSNKNHLSCKKPAVFAAEILLFTWELCEYAEDGLHQVWDFIQPVQSAPRDFSLR